MCGFLGLSVMYGKSYLISFFCLSVCTPARLSVVKKPGLLEEMGAPEVLKQVVEKNFIEQLNKSYTRIRFLQ